MLCLATAGVATKAQPTRGIFGCVCAEAVSDHPTAAPPRRVMNSRRLTRPLRSPRMPEYQISHASTKAIAASRSAAARDVGLGSRADMVPSRLLAQSQHGLLSTPAAAPTSATHD